jgi:hypothetical protein
MLPAAATAAGSGGPATAALSPSTSGARHVALTISLRTELQCGRLMGSRTLVVTLPARARVAHAIPAAAVLVGGRAVSRVAVAGRVVTLSLPTPRGVLCDSIRMGQATIVFRPGAGLGNPPAPGVYTVRVAHGADAFAAPLEIRS